MSVSRDSVLGLSQVHWLKSLWEQALHYANKTTSASAYLATIFILRVSVAAFFHAIGQWGAILALTLLAPFSIPPEKITKFEK